CAFAHLAKNLAFKDDSELRALVLKVDAAADLEEDRDSFFADYKAKHFDDPSFFEDAWQEIVDRFLSGFQKGIALLEEEGTEEDRQKDVEFLQNLLALSKQDQALFWKQLIDENFPVYRKKNLEYKEIHTKANDAFYKPAHAFAKAFPSKQKQWECYQATEQDALEVLSLAKELGERMKRFSYEHACFTFAGIATLAREVVKKNPAVQKQMHEKYRFIMVDEYQDTNDLQETFLNSLQAENVFQVGDVKQSIYAFRNANPALFESKRKSYGKADSPDHLITLADNFRSREPILHGINDLFLSIMSERAGGVDYQDNQALLFGNTSYSGEEGDSHKPVIATYEILPSKTKGEWEARTIAGDIARRISEGSPVQDGSLRPCTYKDFCILVDKRTDLDSYRRVFNDLKIPFEAVEKGESSKKDMTLVFRNLLELILVLQGELPASENRRKHLFVSLERSFLIAEEDETIYNMVKSASYPESPLFQKAKELGEAIRGENLEDAVSAIFSEFAFVEKLPLLGEVKENYATIERFQNLSATFAGFGWDLLAFFSYFSDIEKYDQEFNIEPASSGMDCVHYMTIHASKGLEFPFVYVAGCHHEFHRKNPNSGEKKTATYHSKYGVLLSRIGPEGDDTLTNFLFQKAKEEERSSQNSERMRLFYVALTRAKEYLYLVRPPKKELKKGPKAPADANKMSDFLDAYENKNHAFLEESWPPAFEPADLPLQKTEKAPVELKEVSVPAMEEKPLQRASKAKKERINPAILLEGSRLHRLLELVDWKKKDVSWIKNPKDRQLIEKAISLPLFTDSSSAKAFREYSFVDEEAGVNGT
ncbi:MAG: UvrD-helicase domain-containing protein, partial [Bacilli bacterium]|nr:UvrD-helicase domain-containing protein [Bacilli bacterium]